MLGTDNYPLVSLAFAPILQTNSALFVVPLLFVHHHRPPVPGSFLPAAAAYSRQFASSTISVPSTAGGEMAEIEGSNSNDDVLEPQGNHHPWFSTQPLSEAISWKGSPGQYL